MVQDLANYVTQAHDRAFRNAAIDRTYASGDHSMQAIATAFDIHTSTVSRVISGKK